MKYKSILLGLMLAAGLTATAQVTDSISLIDGTLHGPIIKDRVLPKVTSKIKLLTRAYGDSIVLRWLAEDYVSYHYLRTFGVNVLRVKRDTTPDLIIDTLAYALKPLKFEEFRKKYPANDSLALAAMGSIYGEGENASKAKGEMGGREDLSSSQDIGFAFGMLVCEWRKDLATDMAVRFTDRNVEEGAVYDYYIHPTRWDNEGKIIFEPGVQENVKNEPFKQPLFNPYVTDSLVSPNNVLIKWKDETHSSFEIDRRHTATERGDILENSKWERVTQKPYVSMVGADDDVQSFCAVVDSVPELGIWEYRILGYDAFAELSTPSATHSVFVTDIQPPVPPTLKYIVIERADTTDLMAQVKAHIVWEKDSLEKDLAGYRIYYKPMRSNDDMWQMLTPNLINPKDTLYSVDVTGKTTGMVYISAYDHTGNESKSFIQQMRLTDYKAPGVPTNLRAMVRPIDMENDSVPLRDRVAYVDIYWQPRPEDDDIDYFDLAFANDSTHKFLLRNEGGIRQSMYTDSLSLNVNQRFIYYKVRAVDYSTNIGKWSDWIQVERPHVTPPTDPHLTKSTHDEKYGMHIEWVVGADADMKFHELYRRLGEDGEPELISRYDADSVKTQKNTIVVDDNPPYDQHQRYYYWVTSHNASPFTSSSLPVSWKHQGPRLIDVEIQLTGVYDAIEGETVLMWDLDQSKLPEDDEWHYCVFRKGPGEEKFRYYMSTAKDDRGYRESTLHEGETAEYYVEIRADNGRYSPASNTVSVTATARQELKEPEKKK